MLHNNPTPRSSDTWYLSAQLMFRDNYFYHRFYMVTLHTPPELLNNLTVGTSVTKKPYTQLQW